MVEDAVEHEGASRSVHSIGGCRTGRSCLRRRSRTRGSAAAPLRHGEALPVAGRRRAVAPMAGGVEAGDAVDDGGERGALVLLDETPIADVLEPPVGDAGATFSMVVEAEVAAVRARRAGLDAVQRRVRIIVADGDQRIEAFAHRRRQTLGHALRQQGADLLSGTPHRAAQRRVGRGEDVFVAKPAPRPRQQRARAIEP